MDPDVIYVSTAKRGMQTAERIADIMKAYRNKDIIISPDERLRSGETMDTIGIYKDILQG